MIIGAACGGAVLWTAQSVGGALPAATVALGMGIAAFGALAPDLDHPTSTASRAIPSKLAAEALRIALPVLALSAAFGYFAGPAAGRSLLEGFAPLFRLAGWIALPALALFALSFALRAAFGHRGPTHSLAFAALAAAAGVFVTMWLGAAWWLGALFGVGWLSHVLSDAATPRGVPYLAWPLRNAR